MKRRRWLRLFCVLLVVLCLACVFKVLVHHNDVQKFVASRWPGAKLILSDVIIHAGKSPWLEIRYEVTYGGAVPNGANLTYFPGTGIPVLVQEEEERVGVKPRVVLR